VIEFKLGDRVRIINTDFDTKADPNLGNGQCGTVVEVVAGGVVAIRTDNGPNHIPPDGDQPGWYFWIHQLEHAAAAQQANSHGAGVDHG